MSQNDPEKLLETDEESKMQEEVKMVPVTESIRYRKRAQSAEKKNEELQDDITNFSKEKQTLEKQRDDLKSENELMKKLSTAGAIDLETAVLVTKNRLAGQEDADMDSVIDDLKKNKKYLFENSDHNFKFAGKTAFVRDNIRTNADGVLTRAATSAAKTGSRIDLHEYMKLRRNIL